METCHNKEWLQKAILAIHYLSPLSAILCILLAWLAGAYLLPGYTQANEGPLWRPALLHRLMYGITCSYVAEALFLFPPSEGFPRWGITPDQSIYALSWLTIWVIQTINFDWEHLLWCPYYGCCAIALTGELLSAILELEKCQPLETAEYMQLGIQIIRICVIAFFLVVFFTTHAPSNEDKKVDEESQSLISNKSVGRHALESGATLHLDNDQWKLYGAVHSDAAINEHARGLAIEQGPAMEAIQSAITTPSEKPPISVDWARWIPIPLSVLELASYIWPSTNVGLQLRCIGAALCVVAGRVLKILLLRQLGRVIDALSSGKDEWKNGLSHTFSSGNFIQGPLVDVSLYVIYRWLDSSAGLGAAKKLLWIGSEAKSYESTNKAAFSRLMTLSSDTIEDRHARKVLGSVDHGRIITRLADVALFEAVPTMIDVVAVTGYMWLLFDGFVALILSLTIVSYLWITSSLYTADKAKKVLLNSTSDKESKVRRQVTSCWQTVFYFNRACYETERYMDAAEAYTRALRDFRLSYSVLLAIQSSITCIGFLATCHIAATEVLNGHAPARNFVIFLTCWMGLPGALYSISLYWQGLQDDFIAAKTFLTLMSSSPLVRDKDGAQELNVRSGEVYFENVNFECELDKRLPETISFRAKPGQKVLIVDNVGTGSSAITNLLFRFYGITTGKLEIDGQDVRDFTVESVRENIGYVPKDCVIFDDSILNNIRYAKLAASDQEIFDCCRAAAIHERISALPDGYNTKIGEEGLTLSGGELKRISIARAFLKNPKIIVVDESTHETDGAMKDQIAAAIMQLTMGRTSFIATQCLSTAVDADLILVINDGKIVEQGSHAQLLRENSIYQKMWRSQNAADNPVEDVARECSGSDPKTTSFQDHINETPLSSLCADVVEDASAPIQDKQDKRCNEVAAPRNNSMTRDSGASDNSSSKDPSTEKAEPQGTTVERKAVWKPDAPEFIPAVMRTSSHYGKDEPVKDQEVKLTTELKEKKAELESVSEAFAFDGSIQSDGTTLIHSNTGDKDKKTNQNQSDINSNTGNVNRTEKDGEMHVLSKLTAQSGKVDITENAIIQDQSDLKRHNSAPIVQREERKQRQGDDSQNAQDSVDHVDNNAKQSHSGTKSKAFINISPQAEEPKQTQADVCQKSQGSIDPVEKSAKESQPETQSRIISIIGARADEPEQSPSEIHHKERGSEDYEDNNTNRSQPNIKSIAGSLASVPTNETEHLQLGTSQDTQGINNLRGSHSKENQSEIKSRCDSTLGTLTDEPKQAQSELPQVARSSIDRMDNKSKRGSSESTSRIEVSVNVPANESTLVQPEVPQDAQNSPSSTDIESKEAEPEKQNRTRSVSIFPANAAKQSQPETLHKTDAAIVAMEDQKPTRSGLKSATVSHLDCKKEAHELIHSDFGRLETGHTRDIEGTLGPKLSSTDSTSIGSLEPRLGQSAQPSTDLSATQPMGNKGSVDPQVKKPKRRYRSRYHGFKQRTKTSSEESSSQDHEKPAQQSSILVTKTDTALDKAQNPERPIPDPSNHKEEEEKPKVKRVHFRRGPQSHSEPPKPANPDTRSSIKKSSLRRHLSGHKTSQDSTSSEPPSTTTGLNGSMPSRRRQRFQNWKAKKQAGQKRSGSESSSSAADLPKKTPTAGGTSPAESGPQSGNPVTKSIEPGPAVPIASDAQA